MNGLSCCWDRFYKSLLRSVKSNLSIFSEKNDFSVAGPGREPLCFAVPGRARQGQEVFFRAKERFPLENYKFVH
jgi:hypothetical protein